MVDPDTFLTALYVMVDDLLSQIPLPAPRRRGPALALTHSEVVTLALYGQWAHFEGEAAFYRHADARLRGAFPRLPAHSQYNRAVRACHDAIVAVGQRLARLLDAATCAYEALDSTGVVTRNSKRRGHGWLDGQANKGWCTRLGWYHGLHLLVAVTPLGALTGFGLAPASVADQDLAESFFALRHGRHPAVPEVGRPADGVYVADTGFEGDARWHTWGLCVWRGGRLPAQTQAPARPALGPRPCAAPTPPAARLSRPSTTASWRPSAWSTSAPIPWRACAPAWPPRPACTTSACGSIHNSDALRSRSLISSSGHD